MRSGRLLTMLILQMRGMERIRWRSGRTCSSRALGYTCVPLMLLLTVVGCDGFAGSFKRLDQCGACGGDNSTCRIVSGFFTRPSLPTGYNLIAQLPKGVCNINITELRPSRNYLALRTSDGRYIMNGNWAINWSGTYEAAGTFFSYRRHDLGMRSGEQILAPGPTTDTIDVLIIFQQSNPGIEYKYALSTRLNTSLHATPSRGYTVVAPALPGSSLPPPLPSYLTHRDPSYFGKWPPGSAGVYSGPSAYSPGTPSYGIHTNLVTIDGIGPGLGHDRHPLDPTRSSEIPGHKASPSGTRKWTKHGGKHVIHHPGVVGNPGSNVLIPGGEHPGLPAATLNVDSTDVVTGTLEGSAVRSRGSTNVRRRRREFRWRIMGLTECSQTCGGGIQETIINCVKRNSVAVVDEVHCDPSSKPKPQVIKCGATPCPPSWVAGEWSPCSVTCGDGIQKRNVTCMQTVSSDLRMAVAESQCQSQSVPPDVQTCRESACAHWKIGEWEKCSVPCGRGSIRRSVTCISSDGEMVGDEECGLAEKPLEEEMCEKGPCITNWLFSQWSDTCSTNCDDGVQTRKVVCPRDGICDPTKKPEVYRLCNVTSVCGGRWFTGVWSQCTSPCGPGIQTREVICLKKILGNWTHTTDNECSIDFKPRLQQNCNIKPCEPEWYTSEWTECSKSCDTGIQTRDVTCYNAQHQQVSNSECGASEKPVSRQACNTKECPHVPQDPQCMDNFPNCQLVVKSRLCTYAYYKSLCCNSCTNLQPAEAG